MLEDILHEVKGTNIPTFVLEFFAAKYCATDDPDEINEGKTAVLETLEKNYVRRMKQMQHSQELLQMEAINLLTKSK